MDDQVRNQNKGALFYYALISNQAALINLNLNIFVEGIIK